MRQSPGWCGGRLSPPPWEALQCRVLHFQTKHGHGGISSVCAGTPPQFDNMVQPESNKAITLLVCQCVSAGSINSLGGPLPT